MSPRQNPDVEAKAWLAGVFDRAAPTYDELAGRYHDHFGIRLVELAGVGTGDAVLDVACGRGAVVVPAAQRVGPSGRVLGVDFSPEMVRLARERVEAAGLKAGLSIMDAERLDVPSGSFSVVLCGFGLFFLPHPEQAAAEFRRVLTPGGRIAVSTWGAEDERWAWEQELLAEYKVERSALQRPFDRGEDLQELLRGVGFDDATVVTEQHDVHLADADEWWAWKWSYSLRGKLEQLSPDRLKRLRGDAYERIAEMPAGGLSVRLEALIASGRRPWEQGQANVN